MRPERPFGFRSSIYFWAMDEGCFGWLLERRVWRSRIFFCGLASTVIAWDFEIWYGFSRFLKIHVDRG